MTKKLRILTLAIALVFCFITLAKAGNVFFPLPDGSGKTVTSPYAVNTAAKQWMEKGYLTEEEQKFLKNIIGVMCSDEYKKDCQCNKAADKEFADKLSAVLDKVPVKSSPPAETSAPPAEDPKPVETPAETATPAPSGGGSNMVALGLVEKATPANSSNTGATTSAVGSSSMGGATTGGSSSCNSSGLFGNLICAASEIFVGLRNIIYAVSGFGIFAVALGGFFGNLNWKWLTAIIIGLVVIASANGIIQYMAGSGMPSTTDITDTLKTG